MLTDFVKFPVNFIRWLTKQLRQLAGRCCYYYFNLFSLRGESVGWGTGWLVHIQWDLFGANDTRQEFVVYIGRTGQRYTLDMSVVEDVLICICSCCIDIILCWIHTDEFRRACVIGVASHDIAWVLFGPPRGAGVGSWNHHRGRTCNTTQRTGRGRPTLWFGTDAVFRAVDPGKAVFRRLLVVVQDWIWRQAKMVACSTFTWIVWTPNNSWNMLEIIIGF